MSNKPCNLATTKITFFFQTKTINSKIIVTFATSKPTDAQVAEW